MFPILNLSPTSFPYHPSESSQCTSPEHPVSRIKPGLAIHFTYDIIHISMPFSQTIPPFPSLTESKRLFHKSVSLFCLSYRVIVTIFAWNVPLVCLSYLSLLFFRTLHSDGYIFPFLLCLSLLFFSQLFVRLPQTTFFAFLHFFSLHMVLIIASCTMLWTSIHSSSGTLSDLIPWIYLSLPLYNLKGVNLGHTWMV